LMNGPPNQPLPPTSGELRWPRHVGYLYPDWLSRGIQAGWALPCCVGMR
jgi:hypothetical protein